MTARYFCTYFDENYLNRGLALYDSITQHSNNFELFVLCLTDTCFEVLKEKNLPNLFLLHLTELEHAQPDLLAVRPSRSRVEYYFTCTPALMRFIFDIRPDVDSLTYLDADLYFYENPEILFSELIGASIGIIEHRFSRGWEHLLKFGRFNVGWIFIARDTNGIKCVNRWRQQCLEWCYDVVEEDRFADQKYLDAWPQIYDGVRIITHNGANVALWNIRNYAIVARGAKLLCNDEPILFFHFHGLRRLLSNKWATRSSVYGVKLLPIEIDSLYIPYIKELLKFDVTSGVGIERSVRSISAAPSILERLPVIRNLYGFAMRTLKERSFRDIIIVN